MEDLRKAARSYLNDTRFSDFTVVCAGKEYKVHRCFVCPHSKWFDRCCSGSFAEGRERKVELKDDSPDAVGCMIEYFYRFDYDDSMGPDIPENSSRKGRQLKGPEQSDDSSSAGDEAPPPIFPVQLDIWVYVVADKYNVPGLKALALAKFKRRCAEAMTNVSLLLAAVFTVYKHVKLPKQDRALHKVLLSAWVMGGVGGENGGQDLAPFLAEIPMFAADLTHLFMAGMRDGLVLGRKCSRCNTMFTDVPAKPLPSMHTAVFCNYCGCETLPAAEANGVVLVPLTMFC